MDDSSPIRERLGAMLKQLPQAGAVETASGAETGIARFQELDPDVAIIDIRMPGMSGIELLKRFKNRRPDLFAVILTNHPNQEYREAAHAAGCDRFFHKATEFEQVAAAVEREFQRRVQPTRRKEK